MLVLGMVFIRPLAWWTYWVFQWTTAFQKKISPISNGIPKKEVHIFGVRWEPVCELFVSSNKQLVFCPPVQNNQFSPGRIFFKDSKTQPQRIEFRWNHFWQQHGGPWNAKNHQKDLRFCARIARKCSFVFRVCNALWVFPKESMDEQKIRDLWTMNDLGPDLRSTDHQTPRSSPW